MGQGIKNRIFGSDIPKNVKQKIEYRQAYAKSADPGESITTIDDKYGKPLKISFNCLYLNKLIFEKINII